MKVLNAPHGIGEQVAYEMQVEELYAQLAQAAGEEFPDAGRYVADAQRNLGMNKLQALTLAVQVWADAAALRKG